MDDFRRDVIIDVIHNQIEKLYLAELVQVADFISSLRSSRKFTRET